MSAESRARESRLLLLCAAVVFSTAGAAIKACRLSGWQVACFRAGIAVLALLLMMPKARRWWSPRAFAVGATYAATTVSFVHANKLTTAATTIFLQAAAPLYIAFLGPWLLREPIPGRDLGFMAALAAGLAMIFAGVESPVASAPDPLRGNLVAALSGFLWALTVLGLRWMEKGKDVRLGAAASAVVCGNLIAFLLCLPLALPASGTRLADWLLLSYLGVFQIGLAYVLVTQAIPHVPALETSLLLLLDPVLNPIWTWIIHGERPGSWSLRGGAIILLAASVKTWLDLSPPIKQDPVNFSSSGRSP